MIEATVDAILAMSKDTTLESLVIAGMNGGVVTTLYARVNDATNEVLDVFENHEANSTSYVESSVDGETLWELYKTGGGCETIMEACTEVENADGELGDGKCGQCPWTDDCEMFSDEERAVEEAIAEAIKELMIDA